MSGDLLSPDKKLTGVKNMKQLEIKINIENEAYESNSEEDIIKLAVRDLMSAIHRHSKIIKDINGNTVGSIKIKGVKA